MQFSIRVLLLCGSAIASLAIFTFAAAQVPETSRPVVEVEKVAWPICLADAAIMASDGLLPWTLDASPKQSRGSRANE